MIIDSHCHLEKFHRNGTLDQVLKNAWEQDVRRLVTVGTSTRDWPLYRQLAEAHPGRIHYTAGLHPSDAKDDWEAQLAALPEYFGQNGISRPVALGEIGLDYFHLPRDPEKAAPIIAWQEAAFKAQLALAKAFDCPVIVHSRDCFQQCVAVIDESGFPWERVVFHCFADGPDEILQLKQRGGRGSFTGIITYQNKSADKIREAALAQGPDALIVETDSPYLTPEPKRGQPNEPANTRLVVDYCASLLGFNPPDLHNATSNNAIQFFNLSNT